MWQSLTDVWVQVIRPRFGWIWVQNAMPHGYQTWIRIPAGTRFMPPNHIVHGPPVGAYVCDWPPEDGSDDEPWLSFEMIDGFGPLVPGAIIEMRPGQSELIAAPEVLTQRATS